MISFLTIICIQVQNRTFLPAVEKDIPKILLEMHINEHFFCHN